MTDNGSPVDANAASAPAEEFPSRLRVHALARTLGLTSRQVLEHLAELGIETRSPQSSIDRDVAQAVAARVRDDAPTPAVPEQTDVSAPEETPSAEPMITESTAEQVAVPAADEAPAKGSAADSDMPTLFSSVEQIHHHPVATGTDDAAAGPLFLQPQAVEPAVRPSRTKHAESSDDNGNEGERANSRPGRHRAEDQVESDAVSGDSEDKTADADADNAGGDNAGGDNGDGDGERTSRRRRRGRRGRGRGRGDQGDYADDSGDESSDKDDDSSDQGSAKKNGETGSKDNGSADSDDADDTASNDGSDSDDENEGGDQSSSRRRRRRRRRKGGADSDDSSPDDPPNTVVHEREPRSKRARDEVQGISGSTRLEAKRQRRRDGRDAGRRRPPILSESEFLARREAVDRVMVVRERNANSKIAIDGDGATDGATHVEDYTQVAVLEDGVLVEHFVTTETSSSMVGNIYLGRVQNVLPGMEAAFVDIGRGRNGVLYAGEVNWDAAGLDGGSRKIEQALKPGDNVLVQVSKDPVGHKGARLTTQISLAGRYLVYVPGGSSTGISRKLPDVERKRLKGILSKLVPDDAGVIIRTASEGVSAEELGADIARLEGQWKDIDAAVTKAKKGSGSGPQSLYEEPDLLVRVVRDLFNEDFKKLVVEGDKAWDLVERYIKAVAPDLMDRVERFTKSNADAPDSFVVHRIDEQLAKALDRKVWLPSGGTLIIEHTEAMTVIDVNTGKFTGSGGNLEETVTRNNLEAAEEIVRQMRLRDLGGMIIVDFIDMVLESNRDLVLRRLTEALGRDRTRHQVSEVTSLGLVQMTRKRLGTGLLEAFSTTCTHCAGRGIIVHANPVEVRQDDSSNSDGGGSRRSRRNRRKSEGSSADQSKPSHNPAEHPMFRAMAAHAHDDESGDAAEPTGEEAVTDGAEDSRDERKQDDQKQDRNRNNGRSGRGRRDRSAKGSDDSRATENSDDRSTPAEDAPGPVAVEPIVATEDTTIVVSSGPDEPAESAVVASSDATPPVSAEPKRRRRAVRRAAAAPTTHSEPEAEATDGAVTAPVTTFGPVGEVSVEAVVAVRKRPRRRTAGRPAGPPPGEQ